MVIKPNSTTTNSQVNISDREIIILILEFLESKNLNISQISLERETGIVNGGFSDEVLFLRNLIIEGSWDDAVDYVEPLQQAAAFDYNYFRKIIYRYKYLELLCIKNEVGNTKFSEEAAVNCLRDLETVCDKVEWNEYRLLLSYGTIQEHPDYGDWNPSSARVKCFGEVRPLVENVLQVDIGAPAENSASPPNRLVSLLIKGVLYETAGRLCAQRAKTGSDDLRFSSLLPKSSSPPDMTLLCWLQAISPSTFTCKFEDKHIPLNHQKFDKPLLEASWTEHIQQSPIRMKNEGEAFPAGSNRAPVNDRMVQSMVEQMDGFRRKTYGSASARQRVLSQSFHLGGLGQEDPFVSGMFSRASQSPSRSARAALASDATTEHVVSDKTLETLGHRQNTGEPLSPIEENINSFNDFDYAPESTPQRRELMEEDRKRVVESWQERDRVRDLLVAEIIGVAPPPSAPQSVRDSEQSPVPSVGTAENKSVIAKTRAPDGGTSRVKDTSAPGVIKSKGLAERTTQPLPSAGSSSHTPTLSLENRSDTLFSDNTPTGYRSRSGSASIDFEMDSLRFVPVQVVEDEAFIRCAAFHPSGTCYAVGSNSRTLRFCAYPAQLNLRSLRSEVPVADAQILDSRINYHKGSLFCLAWNMDGTLIASGSNDKLIKLSRFNPQENILQEGNMDLRIHDDTVRDMIFLDDARHSSMLLLISAGADNRIYATDCNTATKLHKFGDHSAPVLSLHSWTRGMFVSGAQDKTCRIWDLRTLSSVKTFNSKNGMPDSTVTCVRVDLSGKVMATAHESGELCLWDLRAGRTLQVTKAHTKDIRSLSFSAKSNFLISASYDAKVRAHSLEGNLFEPLPNVVAASHADKVIQCHMHTVDKSFLTTSADKTCVLWAYPECPE